jgi:phage shock protein A
MNVIKRLFRIGKAEAHAAINSLEDPIKMTEQGIREMKEQLDQSIQALAQVKALAIRRKNEQDNLVAQSEDYQNKAMLLVQKGIKEEMPISEADRLAKEALKKKTQSLQDAQIADAERIKLDADVEKMQANINTLKSTISKWEGELKTLRARVQVSQATQDINRKMTNLDSDSTVAMLEKMKEKVLQQEALADAYSDIANASKSIDQEINAAVDTSDANASEELEKLKEQFNNAQV